MYSPHLLVVCIFLIGLFTFYSKMWFRQFMCIIIIGFFGDAWMLFVNLSPKGWYGNSDIQSLEKTFLMVLGKHLWLQIQFQEPVHLLVIILEEGCKYLNDKRLCFIFFENTFTLLVINDHHTFSHTHIKCDYMFYHKLFPLLANHRSLHNTLSIPLSFTRSLGSNILNWFK